MREPRQKDGLVIRAAVLTDVPHVLALWDHARSSAAVTPDSPQAVTSLIEQPGSILLVAERNEQIVGALIVAWDGWRANMYRLAVLPHLRRQGIARCLVSSGHDHLRSVGARRVTALVAHAEEDAVGLWLSAGYEGDEQISRFVLNL